jgi:CheY-like chemotaxis protein
MMTQMAALVLIVDDNEQNAKLACDVLEAAGLSTMTAATAAEALALAHEHVPDVVLMDLRLPDLDGSEALRRLRVEPATAHIPVVALTAVTGARELLLEAGFAGCVEKPFDVRELPAQVRRVLAPG